jgi:5-bromo-4-chloroindolyl phosphate hydrolysis protein
MNNVLNPKLGFDSRIVLLSAIVTSFVVGTQYGNLAFAQAGTNETTNMTGMNETATQTTNNTSSNATLANKPELTMSDIQDIRKNLEDVKTAITEGKAIDALKSLNEIDDKLLVSMSKNPPPMLEKSTKSD